MAFDTWSFPYTPPPTIASPLPVSSAVLPNALSGNNSTAANSAAGQLIARAQELLAANLYLQSVILARASGLTVPFNPATDPDTAEALAKLFPGLAPPSSLSMTMYNNLLDAELAALQVDRALTGSTNEVNPFQTAAVSQVSQAIENGLLASGQFDSMLPLMLRPLKGDTVLFTSVATSLAQYPVVASPQPSITSSVVAVAPIILSGTDISAGLSGTLNSAFDSFQQSYASVYQLNASVGQVAQDVNNVLSTFVLQPAANLIRMISMFQALQALQHLPSMKSLVNGLTGFAFVELIAEASGMAVMADRFLQAAIQPVRAMTGEIAQMVNQVQIAANAVTAVVSSLKQTSSGFTSGSLKGMSQTYSCGMPHNAAAKKPAATPGLSAMSKGLKSVAQHLDWASSVGLRKIEQVDEALKKLLNRRLGDMNGQLDLLCSLQALQTMTQLAQAVVTFTKNGVPSSSPLQNQLQQVGQILNSTSTAVGTAFVTSNGQTQAVSPTIPTPSSAVQSTLVKGGLGLTVASSTSVTGVANAS